ncbi:hypothetical protein NDU88_007785 [Pleurodeles waltl]|uniref:Uncharacterized protein n=1 Tax=Pleurodeles waltl TaxID=8319 RepID=A0AAV7U143_PLEWA|nr:hypothetical protein NDU88_007785 [Pleurodeles waltl]
MILEAAPPEAVCFPPSRTPGHIATRVLGAKGKTKEAPRHVGRQNLAPGGGWEGAQEALDLPPPPIPLRPGVRRAPWLGPSLGLDEVTGPGERRGMAGQLSCEAATGLDHPCGDDLWRRGHSTVSDRPQGALGLRRTTWRCRSSFVSAG